MILTSSGLRAKVLPPIVKETVGMEARLSHSTTDSPMGLGNLSHNCDMRG